MDEPNEQTEKATDAGTAAHAKPATQTVNAAPTPTKNGQLKRALDSIPTLQQIMVGMLLAEGAWILWLFPHPEIDLTTGLLLSGIAATALILFVPKWQVSQITFSSIAEKFSAENEARKTVATLVGGLAILLSFYTTQQRLGVQQQAQFTDRYAKAIDEIAASDETGKPKLAVRIGGLYVLEQIMDSSEAQHAAILEVLCAYIRDNSLQATLKPTDGPRADTRVALTILGRRHRDLEISAAHKTGWRLLKAVFVDHEFLNAFTVNYVRPQLDLSGSDLTHADVSHLVANRCRSIRCSLAKLLSSVLRLEPCELQWRKPVRVHHRFKFERSQLPRSEPSGRCDLGKSPGGHI